MHPRAATCVLAAVMSSTVLPFLSGASGEEWGPASDGLRMSVSLSPEKPGADRDLQVTIQNISGQDTLVSLGGRLAFWGCMERLRIVLATPNGIRHRVVCNAIAGGLGEIGYLTVPLLAGASYTWRRSIKEYVVVEGPKEFRVLQRAIAQPGRLTVELDIAGRVCREAKHPDYLEHVPCWHGGLVSNSLRLGDRER